MTRGSAYFKIQDTPEQEAEQILEIGFFSDAYPSGKGQSIYDALKNANVTDDRSVERAFLSAFGDWASDHLMDDEYVYTITLKPFLVNKETYSLHEIAHFEVVTDGYYAEKRKVIFDGTSAEFERFIAD